MNPYLDAMAKRDQIKKEKFRENIHYDLSEEQYNYYMQFSNPEMKYHEDLDDIEKKEIREKWINKKKSYLKAINRIRKHDFKQHGSNCMIIPEEINIIIDKLVEESPFKKNRKRRLRLFLVCLYQWHNYLIKLSEIQQDNYNQIYRDFKENIYRKNLVPLPVALMGRWAGLYIPGRIPADKVKSGEARKSGIDDKILNRYCIDKTGRFYVLRKNLNEEEIHFLEYFFIKQMKYRNKSTTKYIFFLDYLIGRRVLTPIVNYSTNCKCKYYKVEWKSPEKL